MVHWTIANQEARIEPTHWPWTDCWTDKFEVLDKHEAAGLGRIAHRGKCWPSCSTRRPRLWKSANRRRRPPSWDTFTGHYGRRWGRQQQPRRQQQQRQQQQQQQQQQQRQQQYAANRNGDAHPENRNRRIGAFLLFACVCVYVCVCVCVCVCYDRCGQGVRGPVSRSLNRRVRALAEPASVRAQRRRRVERDWTGWPPSVAGYRAAQSAVLPSSPPAPHSADPAPLLLPFLLIFCHRCAVASSAAAAAARAANGGIPTCNKKRNELDSFVFFSIE